MSNSPFRRRPKINDIILVPVSEDCWAYLVMHDEFSGWLFDFTTNHPTNTPELFTRSSFKQPLGTRGYFLKRYQTVGKMGLTEEQLRSAPVVHKHSAERQEAKGGPTPYEVFDYLGVSTWWVSEEEAKTYFPSTNLSGQDGEIEAYIRTVLPEMRRIEVAPEDRWTPPKGKEIVEEDAQSTLLVEVNFQCEPEEMLGLAADEIAETLGDDLMVNGSGYLMTMDSNGVDSVFEVILEVYRHRMKGALTQIRKTLKRLKAPPTTRIIEASDTGIIEHPLIAPPKGQ
jgi:hypothetical protein